MIDFLAHILPLEGLRCATLFVEQRVSNHFFTSNAELAAFIADKDGQGLTVYHACASYTVQRRTQQNVFKIKSLWMDVDVGKKAVEQGTGYLTILDAIRGVADFCTRAQLPAPTLVASGSGLHAYWVFDCELTLDQWKPYALGLKRAGGTHNLHFDPARTGDAASILRTPGTTNRKHAPVTVQDCTRFGPYPLELFKGLLDEKENQAQAQTASFGDASHLAYRKPNLASLSLHELGTFRPSFSARIAKQCQQISELRRRHGNLSEPIWYACLGVLAFAQDGQFFSHEWSRGDSRYTAEATDRKLDQARRLSGPTTCRHFQSLNPSGCEGCPFKGTITTPLQLGYEEEKTPPPAPIVRGLPPLPSPYGWAGESLALLSSKGSGPVDLVISKHPIYLANVSTGETRGDFSLTFRQKLPMQDWTVTTVGSQELFNPNGVGALTNFGANIHDNEHFKRYVRAAIDDYYEKQNLNIRYDQYGWKSEGFLYDKLYTKEGIRESIINDELTIRNTWIGAGKGAKRDPSTSLERWRSATNTMFAFGCETQSLAILASFAAPLMRFLAADEGGTILHLVSRETNKGKTQALAGAYTVWGLKRGLSLTNEDNRVTKWLTLAALGNLPLIYDELDARDPTYIRSLILNFTNGRDKMRADRSGQIRHAATEWQTIMISASNTSVVDQLSISNDPEAAAFRVFELEANLPEHLISRYGEKLRNELQDNCGYAGDAYLQYLVQVRDELPDWVQQKLIEVADKTGLSNNYRFWHRLAAVVAVAGTIVRQIGLLEVSIDRILEEWLLPLMVERSKEGKHIDPRTKAWAYTALAHAIAKLKPHTLTLQGQYVTGKAMRPIETPRDQIVARYETGLKRFTVTTEALKMFAVENNLPWLPWLSALKKAGIMGEPKRTTLTAGTELAGAQLYCYEIDLTHRLISDEMPETNVVPIRASQTRS